MQQTKRLKPNNAKISTFSDPQQVTGQHYIRWCWNRITAERYEQCSMARLQNLTITLPYHLHQRAVTSTHLVLVGSWETPTVDHMRVVEAAELAAHQGCTCDLTAVTDTYWVARPQQQQMPANTHQQVIHLNRQYWKLTSILAYLFVARNWKCFLIEK